MWVSRPKIRGGALLRRFIRESDAADGEPGWRDFCVVKSFNGQGR